MTIKLTKSRSSAVILLLPPGRVIMDFTVPAVMFQTQILDFPFVCFVPTVMWPLEGTRTKCALAIPSVAFATHGRPGFIHFRTRCLDLT